MDRMIMACWIGDPLQSLPEHCRSAFEQHFEFRNQNSDISVLSDKSCDYVFYHIGSESDGLLQGVVTMCENLDKKLIVVRSANNKCELPPEHISAEYYTLDETTLPLWLLQIKMKYFVCPTRNEIVVQRNTSNPAQGKPNFAEHVVDYISNNIDKDISQEEVAARCHYSPTYFSKMFHREVGMCFRDYVTAKRISLAKKMLTQDESTKIAYIAYQCGYQDVSYFSRIFKKKTGLSPASYRQQY
ncbi:AraC family transcriptional regulator [Vibrio sp. B1FLJ16]|uniref:helix-turn-helix domain-containing protein n=1 Tax=Vibrio sp. B1FLJ16 TaxID=2751178 RepID=UPI0015F395E3|nr:AraC family transcriptional regulator [Vibrio sp. B1FLJ16]